MPGEDKSVEGDKGHPESVPWSQHVAAKETISNKLKASEERASSLEEQLKNAPNKEAYDKAVKDLETANAKVKELMDAATKASEKTVTELREALKNSKAFTEEEIKGMSETELRVAVKATGSKVSSLPDLSGGGGSSVDLTKISRTKLAKAGYENSPKQK